MNTSSTKILAEYVSPRLGIVVLAAGEGTRMRSALPKVLHEICGRTLLGHVLALAHELAATQTVVVLSERSINAVRARFGDTYTYVLQTERLGTGHAVAQARASLEGRVDKVLVLYGDAPLMRMETARTLLDVQRQSAAPLGLISFRADPPTGYGRVIRDAAGAVVELVEERSATPQQRAITEVNSGVMCFDAAWLWAHIDRIPLNQAKGEYYLTDLVAMAVADGGSVVASVVDDASEAWGINDRAQLAQAEAVLRQRILAALMVAGVRVVDPQTTSVDSDAQVGADTTLHPGTLVRGATSVGVGCEIGPYTTLNEATVGDGARVRYALVEHTSVEAGATVGPFAHLT